MGYGDPGHSFFEHRQMPPSSPPGARLAEPAAPALRLDALEVSYRTSDGVVDAVRGLSLELAPGQVLALTGPSGSGKSSVALAAMGLLPATATVRGRIWLQGRDVTHAVDPTARRAMAMVFQEPTTALHPLWRIRDQVAEPLRVHRRISGAALGAQVERFMRLAGVEEPEPLLGAWPHQLSVGQQQRVLLAQALALEPRVLVADEPTGSLDAIATSQVLETLAQASRELGLAVLLISHDLRAVAAVAQRVATLRDGTLVQLGPPQQPAHSRGGPGFAGRSGGLP